MVELKSSFHYTGFVPIHTQGSTGLTLFCCINYCLQVTEKPKSGSTEKGPGTFDNCKLNNSVKRNYLINQYVLVNLKDIRQHVLVCCDEYGNALFLGPQKTDHILS